MACPGASAPGENWLLELVDSGVRLTVQAHPAELQEHRPGRRVDQVPTDRQLYDRPITFRDGDKPGRVGPAQLMQTNPENLGDLGRIGNQLVIGATPHDDGRDD